jgi:hypothetical protein
MSTIHKNMVDIAKDKAVENAQRDAVEKAIGVMISSSTEVENFQVKRDHILSESQGFINDYKVVSESRADNQYRVVIEADVGMGRLKDRMTAVNLIIARKAKPRLMIIFSEKAQKDAMAEAAMTKFLLSKGFRILDAATIKQTQDLGNLQATLSNHLEAAKIARAYGTEIIIAGRTEAASNLFNISGIDMHVNKCIVSVKVINGDTGEIIATDSEVASAPGIKDDFKAVTEQAADKLVRRIMDNVLDRWSSELTNTVTVNLIVSGLTSYEELLKLKELLSLEVKGYKELYQRGYHSGIVELDMEIRGNTQSVADDVAAVRIDDRRIKILEITQNRIKAQVW